MATFSKIHSVEGEKKIMLLSSVAVNDQIDITSILGRPARYVKMIVGATTDVVECKINNLIKLKKRNETGPEIWIDSWAAGPEFPTFSFTGSLEHVLADGLLVSSLQIDALTLGTGTTIEIIVW